MEAALDALSYIQSALYTALGLVAINAWIRRRGAARAWLAGTFGVLSLVTLLGLVLPEETTPRSLADWVTRSLLGLIVLFPYFLFRFAASFRTRPRWVEAVALALTAALFVTIYFFHDLPGEG